MENLYQKWCDILKRKVRQIINNHNSDGNNCAMQFLQWGLKMRKGLEKSFCMVAWFATKQNNTQSREAKKGNVFSQA